MLVRKYQKINISIIFNFIKLPQGIYTNISTNHKSPFKVNLNSFKLVYNTGIYKPSSTGVYRLICTLL